MSTYTTSLAPAQSFHSTYTTHLSLLDTDAACSLHVIHAFPPSIFVDPYELADQRADAYTFTLTGLLDVELPVFAVPPDGQTLSLTVALPKLDSKSTLSIDVEVPIHARYGTPSEAGYQDILIPPPSVFWHCPATNATTPLLPQPHPTTHTLRIPVGNPRHLAYVESGTALAVLISFLFLAYTLTSAARRLARQPTPKAPKYKD